MIYLPPLDGFDRVVPQAWLERILLLEECIQVLTDEKERLELEVQGALETDATVAPGPCIASLVMYRTQLIPWQKEFTIRNGEDAAQSVIESYRLHRAPKLVVDASNAIPADAIREIRLVDVAGNAIVFRTHAT